MTWENTLNLPELAFANANKLCDFEFLVFWGEGILMWYLLSSSTFKRRKIYYYHASAVKIGNISFLKLVGKIEMLHFVLKL